MSSVYSVTTQSSNGYATPPEQVVDIDALLQPISSENPAGENLKYAGVYDDIREARRADENLAQGEWRTEIKFADWQLVDQLAGSALTTQTKDLQIAAWFVEAVGQLHGFAGVRDGLRVMRGLHEQFWDALYPEIDEDGDLEARANSLAFMDRQLASVVGTLPLTNGIGSLQYSYQDWLVSKTFDVPENTDDLDSTELQRLADLKEQAKTENKITSEDWRAAKNTTSRAFYEETYSLINECWSEYQLLDHEMDVRYERQSPGLSALRKVLDEVRTLIEKIVKEKRIQEPDPVHAEVAGDGNGTADGDAVNMNSANGNAAYVQATPTVNGPIRTRQEAFQRLAEVVAYFRQAEPHNPVSYLVERAIKWGQMPLESWLAEVIKSDDTLTNVRETLGIKPATSEYE